ncbi:phosphodiester glycosidase family protein [Salinarimonas soli]|uniref:Phosphodiester glycosidase domain-containing protein n=1 Tax=Salinarimonas soli TaxID=1638099 RepID=A0A5B2VIT7_9HYPH|nr:phosphodiester glycosidase family protein [Salinarimonas soli]KAA2238107.1 hypothetical protein F0L46_06430 [Salinarimonas soli]
MRPTALALVGLVLAATSAAAQEAPCRALVHEAVEFHVCTADLHRDRVRTFWQGPDGQPYGTLPRLPSRDGGALAFAVNGGMYDGHAAPVGLYVEEGRELKAASQANGPGNFHMKPNGVFYVAGRTAGVMETGRFVASRIKADFATQSGPMLVLDGRIHPRIRADGTSRKLRNGVGIRDGNTIVFANSERPVTFHHFATLFRDVLGCRNALFLDGGTASSLLAPSLARADGLVPLGPMIGVYRRDR